MRTIALPKSTVIDAAKSRGISACEEIDRLLSASLGHKVCSHFEREDEATGTLVFSFDLRCVPTKGKLP